MSDLAQQLTQLQNVLGMGGEHNEGTRGDRGDVFRAVTLQPVK